MTSQQSPARTIFGHIPEFLFLTSLSFACGPVAEVEKSAPSNAPSIDRTSRESTKAAIAKLERLRAERRSVMPKVALWKWLKNMQVEDLDRERAVLDEVVRSAEARQLDAPALRHYFADLMTESKKIQIELFDRWKTESPGNEGVPDIAEIRKEIDRLTPLIIDAWAEVNRQ